MADYEIIAVREGAGNGRTHHIAAVKIGESLFLTDQIVEWINAGAHRFWIWFQNSEVDVIAKEIGASGRYFLTIADGGFPPIALLSLPRV